MVSNPVAASVTPMPNTNQRRRRCRANQISLRLIDSSAESGIIITPSGCCDAIGLSRMSVELEGDKAKRQVNEVERFAQVQCLPSP